jgi:hypothetical protein
MLFTGIGGILAVIVIIAVCAIVFTIAIRREMN